MSRPKSDVSLPALPVRDYKDKILSTVKKYPITLIVGETGSGKTTQIPQYLLEWNQVTTNNIIVCTQPRKVAATRIADRVSYELKDTVGGIVGYQVRLDTRISSSTKLSLIISDIKTHTQNSKNFIGKKSAN